MFPAGLRRRDEPAGEGLFQEEGGCCFQSRPVLGGGQADRGKEVSEEAEDVRFRFEGGPSGCPRYRGLSRAEAAKRPCGCRGSADGKKFVVFHDGPPKRKKMVWHVYLFGAAPVVVADRRAVPDDAVVVWDTAIAVPKYIFTIKTIDYKIRFKKGVSLAPAPVQKLNTFSRHSGRL